MASPPNQTKPAASPGTPPIDPQLEKMFKSIDGMGAPPTGEQKPKFDANLTKALATSIQKVSVLVGRKSGLQSVVLTDEDKDTLADALSPLMDELSRFADYFVYLPLIIFVVGYVAGIAGEILQRRKAPENSREVERQAAIVQRQPYVPPSPPPLPPPVPVPMVPPTVGTSTTVTQSTNNTQTPAETNSSASVSV